MPPLIEEELAASFVELESKCPIVNSESPQLLQSIHGFPHHHLLSVMDCCHPFFKELDLLLLLQLQKMDTLKPQFKVLQLQLKLINIIMLTGGRQDVSIMVQRLFELCDLQITIWLSLSCLLIPAIQHDPLE